MCSCNTDEWNLNTIHFKVSKQICNYYSMSEYCTGHRHLLNDSWNPSSSNFSEHRWLLIYIVRSNYIVRSVILRIYILVFYSEFSVFCTSFVHFLLSHFIFFRQLKHGSLCEWSKMKKKKTKEGKRIKTEYGTHYKWTSSQSLIDSLKPVRIESSFQYLAYLATAAC